MSIDVKGVCVFNFVNMFLKFWVYVCIFSISCIYVYLYFVVLYNINIYLVKLNYILIKYICSSWCNVIIDVEELG